MIFTLPDPQAKIADVLVMLDETQTAVEKTGNSREFKITIEEIALWAGISPDIAREAMYYFISQKRLEIQPGRIVVRNINDLARYASSRRNQY